MKISLQVLCISMVMLLAGGVAFAQMMPPTPTLPGDVNGDGVVNILDVQQGISLALHGAENALADVAGDGKVDIVDIQHLINTALKKGGCVQRVKGIVEATADQLKAGVTLWAISDDNIRISCPIRPNTHTLPVTPNTGTFTIALPILKQWFLFLASAADAECHRIVVPIHFPVKTTATNVLPVLNLSECDVIDLGTVALNVDGLPAMVDKDIRDLLGSINNEAILKDSNGNGIPDFLDALLNEVNKLPTIGGILAKYIAELEGIIKPCVQADLANLTDISLTDANNNGIPDFIEPFLQCIEDGITTWLQQQGIMLPPGMTKDVISGFITSQIPVWLKTLNQPNLLDNSGDGIPDQLRPNLPNAGLPPWLNGNGDGIPDFLKRCLAGEGEGEGATS